MIEKIIKEDLTEISQLSNEEVMDAFELDEDSAEAVKHACLFYVTHDLAKKEPKKRKEFNFGRRGARVTKGGAF